ncbi:MAG: substrate-binding domain-containing protein [Eubacteriaceae bacterium]|nr:substrate-binding domain-containing protein [Eubacteriaceae bacterium]
MDNSQSLTNGADSLKIFCAGVSYALVKGLEEKWNALYPDLPAIATPGGSVDLIRKCIAGEDCDVLISADDTIIRSMLVPQYANSCTVWAGNKMVVAGEGITSENWEEKLLSPNATFKHSNPYGDPGGYRAVMAILLADEYKPGLTDKLMNHPGHIGMQKDPDPALAQDAQYSIYYYSGAKSSGANFAELPEVMDLSSPSLASIYAKACFAVDENNTVVATPISHGLAIMNSSVHKEAAEEYVRMFLEIDKEAAGFLLR